MDSEIKNGRGKPGVLPVWFKGGTAEQRKNVSLGYHPVGMEYTPSGEGRCGDCGACIEKVAGWVCLYSHSRGRSRYMVVDRDWPGCCMYRSLEKPSQKEDTE